ncbi:MAG: hypothetical protein PW792_12370 [Acidobacteriaceae bacterium]|nr:hypothetical protein [Acidobacteriaceae bacterium]
MSTKRSIQTIALACSVFAYGPRRTFAQTPSVVPSQFAKAKTLFLGFEGGVTNEVTNAEGLAILQEALIREHRYGLVRNPSEADLSARVLLSDGGFVVSLFDTKTGMLLWKLGAVHNCGGLKGSCTKQFVRSAHEITDRLEALSAGKIPEQPK